MKCLFCKKEFIPKIMDIAESAPQKYCSQSCRKRYKAIRRYGDNGIPYPNTGQFNRRKIYL